MFNILVFAGTTEGRELAEFCVAEQISASFSVTTDYGAALLPQSEFLTILQGKLDCTQMQQLFSQNRYNLVIDATHPYAVEATKTIRSACALTQTPYYRLLREESTHALPGTVVDSMEDLIAYVNQDNRILFSTMGSKELPALTAVQGYRERVWARLLPIPEGEALCTKWGFDPQKIIWGRGPFSLEENKQHLLRSGAQVLITKETGSVGGYAEKAEAAAQCGVELITIKRPTETGLTPKEVREMLVEQKQKKIGRKTL